jgi:EAL domain-containing protein (putative c-di-GMP-specific phosphodiesterase class I)
MQRFEEPTGVAVVAIGIDNLDTLEDLFGEDLGETLLAQLHERLRGAMFAVAEEARTRRRRVLITFPRATRDRVTALINDFQEQTASDPVDTVHGPVALTVSAGCAFGTDTSECEAQALHALHAAISAGVGSLRIASNDAELLAYRTGLMQASRATMDAIGEDRLTIAFQPVVRGEGGRVISFHECLARIRTREGKVLVAAQFMPAIERLGLAAQIDRRVLSQACDALSQYPLARFSVNIFPQTMQDREWLGILERRLEEAPTLAERLIVEVTETSALLDMARTTAFMDRLRGYGASFALDDFGAGHTTLSYLRDLRFDMIKIDGRFVRGVEQDDDNAFLIESLVRIAHRFDLMTVAEAVQTPAEARRLNQIGVEYFQGFQFGSPSLLLEPTSSPMPMVAAQA